MKTTLILLLAFGFPLLAPAAPLKLSNLEAQRLYAALNSIDAGLSAANTTLLADNMNVLLPKVQAFEKGNAAAQKRLKITATTKTDEPAAEAYLAEIEANSEREITVDLSPVKLSDEEITAAKLRPALLATLRQWLKP